MLKQVTMYSTKATLILMFMSISAEADIKAWCVSKWPDNYEMQEYCLGSQTDANHKMFAFATENNLVRADGTLLASTKGGDMERILSKCMVKWRLPKFDTYNFEMVVYCTDSQVKSYNRMKDK